MIFKEGCFYKEDFSNRELGIIHLFYFQYLSSGLINNVYGYYNINLEKIFCNIILYSELCIYKEISIDEAMELFPDSDKMKIAYNRKNKIKRLLNDF